MQEDSLKRSDGMNRRTRLERTLFLISAHLSVLATPCLGQEESWIRISLPHEVSLELPSNWTVLSDGERVTLQAWAETYMAGPSQSNLEFAANLYDGRGNTIAIVNLRYYRDLDITQAEARQVTDADVPEIDAAVRNDLEPGLRAVGIEIQEWLGTSRTQLSDVVAFVTEYRRSSIVDSGIFRVRLVRVFNTGRSFTLTVSHHEALEALLDPITNHIIGSLQVGQLAAQESPMTTVYGEQWPLLLGISFLLTWGIGLAPPLLIRYAIRRRPMGRGAAIGLVAALWVFNVLLFSAMGSQRHSALSLVAIVSYWILRRGASPGVDVDSENEDLPSPEGLSKEQSA